jgi:hypothetical protein
MNTHIDINKEEEMYLEVELLNQACLALAEQIEQLEKENAQLKIEVQEGNGSLVKPELSDIKK